MFSELSHPSGVLSEASPFQCRWESFERLPNQKAKGRYNACCWQPLTVYLRPFRIPTGKDLINESSSSWVSHNVSGTRSSKLRWQHASATAAVLDFDTTSSPAINLMISSTLRRACVGPGGCVLLCRRDTKTKNPRSVPTLLGVSFKSSWAPLRPLRARTRRSTTTVGGARRSPPQCTDSTRSPVSPVVPPCVCFVAQSLDIPIN